jgi:hypothetical protein
VSFRSQERLERIFYYVAQSLEKSGPHRPVDHAVVAGQGHARRVLAAMFPSSATTGSFFRETTPGWRPGGLMTP